jgi:acyl-CoA synthetase (AMP-forming)/AMP-acid ligase II/3-oxoacyl-(acyl-carrier-protein) synthase
MKHPLMLIDVLERRFQAAPDTLTFDGCPLHVLRSKALRLAHALRERGLVGQPVLVAASAGLDYVTCLLGCLYAGAIMVPAYPPTSRRLSRANQRIASILTDAGVRFALTPSADATASGSLQLETLWLDTLRSDAVEAPELSWSLDPDAVCLLQYTSGSTASPKGVAVSMRQLTANLVALTAATQVSSSDVLVSWLPPYHDMGLLGCIFWPLFVGVATYILPPESFIRRPRRWLAEISARRASVTMAPNFAFDLCVRRIPEAERTGLDLSSLRVVGNGAEPIHPQTLEAFATAYARCGFERRAFFPCYGLAEATLFVAGSSPAAPPVLEALDAAALERHEARRATSAERVLSLVSCGKPGTATEIRIVSPHSQIELGDRQIGEVWVSGPSVATGYWKRPEATRERFHARIAGSDEGPFLRTGDLGFKLDGELFVTGRLTDLIIVRGQNHYPHDIERTVQALHPAFRAEPGAAFSVEVQGEERVVVVQEIDHRQGADPEALISEALEAVRQLHGLSLQACVIVRRGSVARTASGKVQRQAMKRAYLDGALDVVARWNASLPARELAAVDGPRGDDSQAVTRTQPVGRARQEAIAQFLRVRVADLAKLAPNEIEENVALAQYGIDSLLAAELTASLEEFLHESLPATLSYEQPTIAALARALSTSSKPAPRTRSDDCHTRAHVTREPIAIVGMSCRFPGAPNLESFWDLLASGGDAISEVPPDRPQLAASGARFGGFIPGIDCFDSSFFGISGREAARMDPQQRLFLELTWAALEDAGIPPSNLRETDAGVFAGVCTDDYALLHAGQLSLIDADYGTGHAKSVVANRVSYTLDLRGPSMTIDTACSSALVALHLATESLRRGECSIAIVGGVNAVLAAEPGVFFAKARTLAADGRCKTFDASADGFVRSEGCGVIVLKRLADAEAAADRIYARVEGSATNHDGCSNGLMAPSLPAQERLLRGALQSANVGSEQVDYIEAHGVGTPISDTVELSALARVFARRERPMASPCYIGSAKTNLGHLEAASGIAGVIKTALALTHELIPPHLHFKNASPHADLTSIGLAIPARAVPWPRAARTRFAGVSAFGFGGTNAHVVLRESTARKSRAATRSRPHQLLAISAKDPAALRELAAGLATRVTDANLPSVCFTMNAGRDHFAYRAAIVAGDASQMRAGLARIATAATPEARRREPRIACVFKEVRLRAGVARELNDAEPTFRRALERGARIAEAVLDRDPLPQLLSNEDGQRLEFPQTSGVVLQYALYTLLEHWRVAPTLVAGSGSAEFAAACAAGALGWHDGLRLAAQRELLLQSLVPGARVRQTLRQFKAALAGVDYTVPALPLWAAGLGRSVADGETLDQKYWLSHLYAAAETGQQVAALDQLDVECQVRVAADGCEYLALLQTIASVYEQGAALDFNAFHADFDGERIGLPSYAFQRKRCWLEVAPAPSKPDPAVQSTHPFLRARVFESTGR